MVEQPVFRFPRSFRQHAGRALLPVVCCVLLLGLLGWRLMLAITRDIGTGESGAVSETADLPLATSVDLARVQALGLFSDASAPSGRPVVREATDTRMKLFQVLQGGRCPVCLQASTGGIRLPNTRQGKTRVSD